MLYIFGIYHKNQYERQITSNKIESMPAKTVSFTMNFYTLVHKIRNYCHQLPLFENISYFDYTVTIQEILHHTMSKDKL